MVAGTDHKALRAQAEELGEDRKVTVDQRALIDKQLARYSRAWSTQRELIQNAADAAATRVVIKIETNPSTRVPAPQSDDPSARLNHVLHNHTINQWVVENDGHVFASADWARLQEISSGNPDEDKIGAFGVGFYSVFDITERPYISSGSEALEFYWNENELRTKRFRSPPTTDTVFQLPVRDSAASVPHGKELLSLCEFLANSMTFVKLQSIELYIDDWRILHLTKAIAPAVPLQIPADFNTRTSDKVMRVSQITQQAVQFEATWMKALESTSSPRNNRDFNAAVENTTKSVFSFFKKKFDTPKEITTKQKEDEKPAANAIMHDLTATSKHKVFYHVNKASVSTNVNREMGTEFLRLRKKSPPKATTLSFLAQSYDEQAASSLNEPAVASRLFRSVIPENKGYIYIGFTLSQKAPALVPTVEREQLDLNSKHIKEWNTGLLQAAGIVSRISWLSATADLQERLSKYPGMTERKVLAPHELQDVLPAVKCASFDWSSTTPNSDVRDLIEYAFWHCGTDFSLISSRGFVPLENVRVSSDDLSFVEDLPILPQPLLQLPLIKKLRAGEDLKDVQIDDIVIMLEKSKKTRTSGQLQQLLTYLATRARAKTINQREIRAVLNATVASDDEVAPPQIIALSEVKEFINPEKISPDMPVPASTIPFKYTKKLGKFDTDALGLRELDPLKWLQWLVDSRGQLASEQDYETNPTFAANVLKALSKNWNVMSPDSKIQMTVLLDDQRIIPTKLGMKKPSETYFSSVKLFADLPVIVSLSNVKEVFLSALGVRKTLDIGLVFDRLMSGSSQQWSHEELIRYLASVWNDVPTRDRERLNSTPICPAEPSGGKPLGQLYRISELYEPNDSLRRLGLPILRWSSKYNAQGKEAELLGRLGLRHAPPYTDLINLIATAGQSANWDLREFALKYLIENSQSKGYNTAPIAHVNVPFLPVQGSEAKLVVPADCFTNERAAVLGFDLLREDLHKCAVLLGVPTDPPIERCIQRLTKKPPKNRRQAREMFGYMTARIGILTNQHIEVLGNSNIVPMTTPKDTSDSAVRYVPPRLCFLGDGGDLAGMLDFVEFGKEAEMFLLRCGSKHVPSVSDLAFVMTQQPAKMLSRLDIDKYMDVLVRLASQWAVLKQDKPLVQKMRQASFLLATKIEASNKSSDEDIDDTGGLKKWHLAKASDIVIVDEIGNYNLFKNSVLAAPQNDEMLENMYEQLGSPGLTSLVEERQQISGLGPDNRPEQKTAVHLQSVIRERARLFLYDYSKESLHPTRDTKWLENSLSVQTVRSIVIKTSMRGTDIKHIQQKSAALRQGSNQDWTICVTENYNMAHVSRALARLLLVRAKPRDWMVLTEFLRSELSGLQEAGINVERILRQREKEAKVAQERHQQQLEQEQRAREEREALQRERNAQKGQDPSMEVEEQEEQDLMPGNFPRSNDAREHETEDTQKPPSLFGGLTAMLGMKMLGLDNARKPQPPQYDGEHMPRDGNAPQPTEHQPPPYSDLGPNEQAPPAKPPGPMTPLDMQEVTQRAVQTTRTHTSSALKSTPSVHKVEEIHTTCDPKPGMNIIQAGTASNLRVFLDAEIFETTNTTASSFMTTHRPGLAHFASIIQDCATIYNLPIASLSIFCDSSSATMAFNKSNSLFFNYRFFQTDHLHMVETTGDKGRDAAVRHWATTTAHELAHNIEGDHNVRFQNVFQALIE
ncbi:MAG: hypothetical protein Q9168_004897, partial [Polycauliona sp. 1 TL-2023]